MENCCSVLSVVFTASLITAFAVCAEDVDPCALALCRTGTECVSETVQCYTDPCPRMANCIPIDHDDDGHKKRNKRTYSEDEYKNDTCSSVQCQGDFKCVVVLDGDEHPRALCVPTN